MAERILVSRALDERKFLEKKIDNKVEKFVNTLKRYGQPILSEEFRKEVITSHKQIIELIDRSDKIYAAILASNEETKITTSYGEITVAEAIVLLTELETQIKASDARTFIEL